MDQTVCRGPSRCPRCLPATCPCTCRRRRTRRLRVHLARGGRCQEPGHVTSVAACDDPTAEGGRGQDRWSASSRCLRTDVAPESGRRPLPWRVPGGRFAAHSSV